MEQRHKDASKFYRLFMNEAGKLVIGLEDAKEKELIACLSEIPKTYSENKHLRANSGAVWFMGVPGVGKTFCLVVIAGVLKVVFGRFQGRSDATPSEILGLEIWNPKEMKF